MKMFFLVGVGDRHRLFSFFIVLSSLYCFFFTLETSSKTVMLHNLVLLIDSFLLFTTVGK